MWNLDAGLRLGHTVGIAPHVVPAVEHQHLQAQVVRTPLRDRESEKTRADDDEINVHKRSCFWAPGFKPEKVYDQAHGIHRRELVGRGARHRIC